MPLRALRWGLVAALGLVLLPLVRTSSAVSFTVPCTGSPNVDGQAFRTLLTASTGDDTFLLAGGCSYLMAQTVVVPNGRTLTLSATGTGHASLIGNGVPLVQVQGGGSLLTDHVDYLSGQDEQSGQVGQAGNISVSGTLTMTDANISSGTGDLVGNLLVAAESKATLTRVGVLAGKATLAGGATDLLNRGELVLTDVTVLGGSGAADTIRTDDQFAETLLTSVTVIADNAIALHNNAGLTRTTDSVLTGAGTSCKNGNGQGLQFASHNLVDDGSCLSANVTVVDPRVHTVLDPPGSVAYAPPQVGSPAIDATTCTSANGTQDVRGAGRVFGPACDLGAYESHGQVRYDAPAPLTPTDRTRTLRLTDTGTDEVLLDPTPVVPAGFTAGTTTCGANLPAGQSCTWEVSYQPTSSTQQGDFAVADNAAGAARAHLVGQPPTAAPPVVPPPVAVVSPTPAPVRAPVVVPRPTRAATTPPRLPRTEVPTAPSPTPGAVSPSPSPSPQPVVAAPPARPAPDLDSWDTRHRDTALPWFVRNVRTAGELDAGPGKVARNLLLAMLLLALLNLPVNLINKALEEHGGDLARMLAGARRRVPDLALTHRLPGVVRLGIAILLSAAISSLLDPSAGLDRQTAITFLGLLVGIGVISTVATSVEDTWCERRLRVRATLTLFPGFWLLSATCLVVSRLVGLQPGLVIGSLAGVSAARALSRSEDGQRVLVVQIAVLALGAYSWVAYGPLAHDAQHTHALHTEVLAAATGTVFVGVLGGTLLTLVPLGALDGAILRRWSTPLWAAVTFVALFGFVLVIARDDGSDPLLQHPAYLALLLAGYLLAAAAFLGFWRWYERSPRAEQLRSRHAGVADA